MLGNVDGLPAPVRTDVVVGKDGSNQENTKSRTRVLIIQAGSRLAGSRPSVRKKVPWGTLLHSKPLVWIRDQSQVIVKLMIVAWYCSGVYSGYPKRGEVDGAIFE
jgi:hypothetical protein